MRWPPASVTRRGTPSSSPTSRRSTTRRWRAIHDPGYLEALAEAGDRGGGWLDPDTYIVPGSLRAARLAAGATLQAAIAAAAGEAEVAFAVVRPPGHHASRARGTGFCLLNNVAVAVAGLRTRGLAQRIAIVDWDVHHGDGTQAIFDADADLCYASTHQSPLYPGTGDRAERGARGGGRHEAQPARWLRAPATTRSSKPGTATCFRRWRRSRPRQSSSRPATTRTSPTRWRACG